MTKLLLSEGCLPIQPTLVLKFGLNEAIILQQFHYWLNKTTVNPDINCGGRWIYNSYDNLHKQIPFLSESTIKRAIYNLEKKGILLSRYSSTNKYNRTKWYSIDYSILYKDLEVDFSEVQYDQVQVSKCTDHQVNLEQSYIEETKNTTKIINKNSLKSSSSQINELKSDDLKEREMLEIWNNIINVSQTKAAFTEWRKEKLSLLLDNHFDGDIEKWKDFCIKISSSKFLMGEGSNSGFKASIDWVLNPYNAIKILENNYKTGDRQVVIPKLEQSSQNVINSDDPVWKQATNQIIKKLGYDTFKSWFSRLSFLSNEEGIVRIDAHSRFVKEWVQDKYGNMLKEVFLSIDPSIHTVKFDIYQ